MTPAETRQRFDELLPWYVNGTLAKADRQFVENYLRENPQAQTELHVTQALRIQVRESVPAIPADLGMEKLLHRVRGEKALMRKPVQAPTLSARLSAFFGGFKFTPAFAGAAALVVVQGLVIGGLMMQLGDTEESLKRAEYRALNVAPGAAASTPLLRISFTAEAREADIRAVLQRLGGTFVGGPTNFGDYLILVDPARIEELSALAAKTPVVANVTIVRNAAQE